MLLVQLARGGRGPWMTKHENEASSSTVFGIFIASEIAQVFESISLITHQSFKYQPEAISMALQHSIAQQPLVRIWNNWKPSFIFIIG